MHFASGQGRNRYLGTFETELEAAVSYSDATLEMFGEEAVAGSSLGRAQLRKIMLPGFAELAVEQMAVQLNDSEILEQLQRRRAHAAAEESAQQDGADDTDPDAETASQSAVVDASTVPPFLLPPDLYSPSKEEPMAYAKLWLSPDQAVYLRKQVLVLGRASRSFQRAAKQLRVELPIGTRCGGVDCHMGNDPSIDYEHAVVEWNQMAEMFQLRSVTSKGSVFVDKQPLSEEDDPVLLSNGSVVQIGSVIFYFVLPRSVPNRQLITHVVKEDVELQLVGVMNRVLERRANMGQGIVQRELALGKEYPIQIKQPIALTKKAPKVWYQLRIPP
jgi:hypothetical protein